MAVKVGRGEDLALAYLLNLFHSLLCYYLKGRGFSSMLDAQASERAELPPAQARKLRSKRVL